jgi:hypothetical protein
MGRHCTLTSENAAGHNLAVMTTGALPRIIEEYMRLASSPDPADAGRIASCFTKTGRVTDEGTTRLGRDAIREWWAGPANTFNYTVTVQGNHELGSGRFVVFTQLHGDFPGGVADLANRFTVDGDLIEQLEIATPTSDEA